MARQRRMIVGTYNVFRHRDKPALYCAVRQDRPVPGFLEGERWDYSHTLQDMAAVPVEFRPEAAEEATRHLGFYVFHAFSQPEARLNAA
ncbi:hypothetical protein [Methylobacterium oryzisoli]|uniref:hypothetical protein n=1 Tax=Methylobacterium oryzisoli TaxID=3385502 RepID=UPI0038923C57